MILTDGNFRSTLSIVFYETGVRVYFLIVMMSCQAYVLCQDYINTHFC